MAVVGGFSALVRAAGHFLEHFVHGAAGDEAGDREDEQRDADERRRDQEESSEEIAFHKGVQGVLAPVPGHASPEGGGVLVELRNLGKISAAIPGVRRQAPARHGLPSTFCLPSDCIAGLVVQQGDAGGASEPGGDLDCWEFE